MSTTAAAAAEAASWDWEAVATVVAAGLSGLGGAAIGGYFTRMAGSDQRRADRDVRQEERAVAAAAAADARKAELAFSVLEIVGAFEAYALACARVISDNNSSDNPYEDYSTATTTVPPMPAFPDEIDWRLFGAAETRRVRLFRTKVDIAKESLSGWHDYIDVFDAMSNASKQAAELAKEAWTISSELCREHGISEPDTSQLAWDYLDTIDSHIAELERRKAEAKKARRKRTSRKPPTLPV